MTNVIPTYTFHEIKIFQAQNHTSTDTVYDSFFGGVFTPFGINVKMDDPLASGC